MPEQGTWVACFLVVAILLRCILAPSLKEQLISLGSTRNRSCSKMTSRWETLNWVPVWKFTIGLIAYVVGRVWTYLSLSATTGEVDR